MQIAFTTSGLPFNGDTLKTSALGGSETAMLCVANELAKLGHDVRVYCECDKPGTYDGVQYNHHSKFSPENAFNSLDVHVSSRWSEFLAMYVPSALRVLWCHDVCPPDTDRAWLSHLYQTDFLMMLSDFQIEDYLKRYPWMVAKIWKTSNGVDLELVDANKCKKVPKKIIYTSFPDRGLVFMLRDILPKLLEKDPEIRFYHSTYDRVKSQKLPEQTKQIIAYCHKLSEEIPAAVAMGHLAKAQLYKHISSAELMVYPTTWPEISCIAAMEAAACGTPIVTTDDFALRETVGPGCGVRIPGSPTDSEYIEHFVQSTLDLLRDEKRRNEMANQGRDYVVAKGYTWQRVAKSWEQEFQKRLRDRAETHVTNVIQNLVRQNDLKPAQLLSDKRGLCQPEVVPCLETRYLGLSEIVPEYKRALRARFQHAMELLKFIGARPKRILEYDAASVSPGLALAKWTPEAEVVISTRDVEIQKQLSKHAESHEYANVKVLGQEDQIDGEFDLIILHECLEELVDPQERLNDIQKKYLKKNGVVLLFTRFGTRYPKLDECHDKIDRYWNFDIRDLQMMFGEARDFNATFSSLSAEGKVERNAHGEMMGHWITVFRNFPNAKNIDLEGKLLRTRPYQTIAACMIASNAEDWIGGAIKSLKPIVDDVYVCVNVSEDQTEAICLSLGANIYKADFDNFSQVRNVSKEGVESDWIVWIDADERLVSGDRLRKYLVGNIFNGYAIAQRHLMLDLPGSFDLPIRLFRNKSEYHFVGYIHEHCEDTSRRTFDDPIAPTLVLPDVDIAHYGYVNERMRRWKCSARNINLLIRDIEDNTPKGRVLTWVLVIRDYLNMVKWAAERRQSNVFQKGSFEHICLESAVVTFLNHFDGTGHRYEELARPMYEEALAFLGKAGLPFNGEQAPPFEVGLALFAGIGGVEDKNIEPNTRWFRNQYEFRNFIILKERQLSSALGFAVEPLVKSERSGEGYREPDHASLLSHGIDVVERSE